MSRFPENTFVRLSSRVLVVFTALACSAHAAATDDQLTQQRERFPLVWEAAQHGPDDAWRKLASGLESYPLYPYLELASLQRKLTQLEPGQVNKFLTAWPDSLPAHNLREAFLLELARRQDWKNFLALYTDADHADANHGKEQQCDALQARIALGQSPDFKQDIEPLWLSTNTLPAACDGIFAWAQQQGKLTTALIWQRIDLAAVAANAGLVGNLAGMLADEERAAAEHTALALREPATALMQAPTWPDGPRARDAVAVAFERLARHDSEAAEAQWAKFGTHFHFDTEQHGRIQHALALYRATSYSPDALGLLDALPDAASDDATREWRVRVALAAQDWKATLAALDRMSATQKTDARWRYLRARILVKLDRSDEARPIFASVAHEANFHGFLAADWLQQPYTICQSPATDDVAAEDAMRQRPGLARAFEFFAINRLHEARREWDYSLAQLEPRERRLAVAAASHLGWYDRAVYALSQGDDLHLYDLRFPLARRAQIEHDAQAAGVEPAWAYGLFAPKAPGPPMRIPAPTPGA